MAQFDPPVHRPIVLRGVVDDAAKSFRDGMAAYATGDYQAAVRQLQVASRLDENRPDYSFFLGIALLLTDDTPAASAALQRTIDYGESPFLEDAHFFLAKARLRAGDLQSAHRALAIVARSQSPRGQEASELLEALDDL